MLSYDLCGSIIFYQSAKADFFAIYLILIWLKDNHLLK